MKKLLPILGIAAFVTACNSTPEIKSDTAQSVQQQVTTPDTTGIAAFNAWKAQNELGTVSSYQQPEEKTVAATPKAKSAVKKAPVSKPKVATQSSRIPSSLPGEENKSGSTASTGNGSGTNGTSETQAEKKEGWSKAAKGAVIGGVAGAAGGAVINKKNRVLGAVIGGVVGAAGGYGVGRTMDKKDGRIDYSTIVN